MAPLSDAEMIKYLRDLLAEMTDERDWLWERFQWISEQEWRAWERVRALEHEVAVLRSKRQYWESNQWPDRSW